MSDVHDLWEIKAYASRNNPASLKHLTLVFLGNNARNSSQCSIVASPPAEHPERRACIIHHLQPCRCPDMHRPDIEINCSTWLAWCIPCDINSSIAANHIRCPLKYKFASYEFKEKQSKILGSYLTIVIYILQEVNFLWLGVSSPSYEVWVPIPISCGSSFATQIPHPPMEKWK